VAGFDTIRGIGFQQACALDDAVDLVLDPEAALLRVEGAEDVVDYETVAADGRRLRVRQAKTRQEPGTWSAGELAPILRAWAELGDADGPEFAFVTDGQLGESGVALRRLLEAARAGATKTEFDAMVEAIPRVKIDVPAVSLLRRVELVTRAGTVGSVLERLELRVLRLIERGRVATADDATAVVDRLFRLLFEVGGERLPWQREVTKQQILDALGLTGQQVTGGGAWNGQARDAYQAQLLTRPTRPDILVLDVLQVGAGPRVLQLGDGPLAAEAAAPQPPEVMLEAMQSLLVGPTGTGKTTCLDTLSEQAASRGGVPVLLRADGHLPGILPRRVHEAVAGVLGQRLTAVGVEQLLADPGLLLLIDGVSEVDSDTRAALAHDLQTLAAQRAVQVIGTGRDLAAVRSVVPQAGDSAAFALVGLSPADRRAIARARKPEDPESTVAQIEGTLGDAVDNPLLFGMAITVGGEQAGSIQSRPQVYREFLAGLAARARLVDTDVTFAALGMAWSELLAGSRRATDGYEWRQLLAVALERLDGTGAFAGHATNAGLVLAEAQAMGLLVRPDLDAGLVPLHDSFADYLAGVTLARDWIELPGPLVPAQDEQVLFAVEIAGLSDGLTERLVDENPLLACRVAAMPEAEGAGLDPERVAGLLATLVAGAELPSLAGRGGVRVLDTEEVVGVVLVDGPSGPVELPEFNQLAAEDPSWLFLPGTGSLAVALNVWASAVRAALQPTRRLSPRLVPTNPDAVVEELVEHEMACTELLTTTVKRILPSPAVGDRVLSVLDRGLVAVVEDPQPGPYGRPEIPVVYRRGGGETLVVRDGDPRVDKAQLSTYGDADQLLHRHPVRETAKGVLDTLEALAAKRWPAP
jgi:hypothetical protein